jgi:hypothetical protein
MNSCVFKVGELYTFVVNPRASGACIVSFTDRKMHESFQVDTSKPLLLVGYRDSMTRHYEFLTVDTNNIERIVEIDEMAALTRFAKKVS